MSIQSYISIKKRIFLTKLKLAFGDNSNSEYFQNLLGIYKNSKIILLKPKSIILIANSGEIVGIDEFIKNLKKTYPDHNLIALIEQPEALRVCRTIKEIDGCYFLCIDDKKIAEKTFKQLKASLIIFLEKARCQNIFECIKKLGITHGIINAILTEANLKNPALLKLNKLLRKKGIFRSFDFVGVQTERDMKNFLKLDLKNRNMQVIGVLKANFGNFLSSKEKKYYWKIYGKKRDDKFIVAGGTYLEEPFILDAFFKVRKIFPNFRLVICPRILEKIPELIKSIKQKKFSYVMKSNLSEKNNAKDVDIIIGDTFGDLNKQYGISEINILGRSFLPYDVTHKGGSNLFEAAIYGKPIIFGKNMESHINYITEVISVHPELQVLGEQLGEKIVFFLKNPKEAKKTGKFLKEFALRNSNASNNYIKLITKHYPFNNVYC